MTKEQEWSDAMWQAHRKIMLILNSRHSDAYEKMRQIAETEQNLLKECDRITFAEEAKE